MDTRRLHLRPWSPCDVDPLHALWIDPQVRRFLFDDVAISRDLAAEIVTAAVACAHATGLTLCSLRRLETPGVIIGFAGLRWLDEASRQPELIYGLAADHWGQGLATEASQQVLADGFLRLGLATIWATTDLPNLASVKVMQRLGMSPADCPFAGEGLISYHIQRDDFRPFL